MKQNIPILFTKKGYEQKQKEYDALLLARPSAVRDLAKAREMGDLSENGYYKAARFKLSDIDRQLRFLKYMLKSAKVQDVVSNGQVNIGSFVTITNEHTQTTYEIVGTYESNPSEGTISHLSPLGKIIMGKREGENVVLLVGDTRTEFLIVSIR